MTSRGRAVESTTLGGALGGAAAIVVVAGVAGRVPGRGTTALGPDAARAVVIVGVRVGREGGRVARPAIVVVFRVHGGSDRVGAWNSAARFRGEVPRRRGGVRARSRDVELRETKVGTLGA